MQLKRLFKKQIRIAVFGKVGVGKSSLLNALLQQEIFATDVANGCTRETKTCEWMQSIRGINKIQFVDTPGIDEIASSARGRLASRLALQVDLVMFVIDSDITSIELSALQILANKEKPILLVLNRCDQWSLEDQRLLINNIRNRLPKKAKVLSIQAAAASPRKAVLENHNKVRSYKVNPEVTNLKDDLINILSTQGELLLAINALKQADLFSQCLKAFRLKKNKIAAQGLIGRFAAIKASGVAANPLLILDFAGSLACDTALVIQLSKLYGLQIRGKSARELLKRLSIYNSFIGGAQLGIQVALGILRQFLIISTPFTNGLSLASSAPVALVQAALAVQTTKLTGRLAAKELLLGMNSKGTQPRSMIKRIAKDPEIKSILKPFSEIKNTDSNKLQTLLP